MTERLSARAVQTVNISVWTRNPPEIIMNPNCSYCWLLSFYCGDMAFKKIYLRLKSMYKVLKLK